MNFPGSTSTLFPHHTFTDPHPNPSRLSSLRLHLPLELLLMQFASHTSLPPSSSFICFSSQISSVILTSPSLVGLFRSRRSLFSPVRFGMKAHFMPSPSLPFSSRSSPVVFLLFLSSLTSVASGVWVKHYVTEHTGSSLYLALGGNDALCIEKWTFTKNKKWK